MTTVVVLDDYLHRAAELAEWTRLGPEVVVRFLHDPLAGDELVGALEDAEVVVCMRERTALPATSLARLERLRLVVTTGMANASIDLDHLAERGIPVSGTGGGGRRPGVSTTTEVAWALILATTKRVGIDDRLVRRGGWHQAFPRVLSGATLGLLGLGRLGAEMVGPARAFGMEVVVWSEHLSDDRAAEVGAVRAPSLEELLSAADVVSIHLRLSERTRGLLGRRELAVMKPSAVLVNTSRGPIVEEAALVEALASKRLAAAGLDVYDVEPLPAGHPLTTLDNAVLSPHLGYVSEEGFTEMYAQVVEDVGAFLAGHPIRVLDPGA